MYKNDIHLCENVYLNYTLKKDWIFILSDPFHIIRYEKRLVIHTSKKFMGKK